MKLATVEFNAQRHAAIATDDGGWILTEAADVAELISRPDKIDAALRAGRRVEGLRVLLPLRSPRKIVCCGLNYRDHIAETGRETPEYPTLFAKFSDTLTDPDAKITVENASRVDWEAELGVVVGATVRRADQEAAAKAIFGYTVANDVSMRDWQSRTLQWFQGKAFDATTPLGPVVVTADEFDPAVPHQISTAINDEIVQDSDTSQLLFSSADLVSYVSQFTTLDPGDIILTGTPGGVGLGENPPRFLRDGDIVTVSIEGIGSLRNTFSLPLRRNS